MSINSWINNREAGDLRQHRAHYDVTVMLKDCGAMSIIEHVCTLLCFLFYVYYNFSDHNKYVITWSYTRIPQIDGYLLSILICWYRREVTMKYGCMPAAYVIILIYDLDACVRRWQQRLGFTALRLILPNSYTKHRTNHMPLISLYLVGHLAWYFVM